MSRTPAASVPPAAYHIVGSETVHSVGEDDEQNMQGGPSVLDQAESIRNQTVNWASYYTAGNLSDGERELLEKFDKMKLARQNLLQESGSRIVDAYLRLLVKSSNPATLQYILTIFMDIFIEFPDFGDLIVKRRGAWEPLWLIVNRRSRGEFPYIVYQASRVLSRILATGDLIPIDEASFYINWLREILRTDDNSVVELALNCLRRVLRREQYRARFSSRGIEEIRTILTGKHVTMQLQYLSVLCLWILSFTPQIAATLDNDDQHIIAAVVGTVRTAKKDKVIRICLALLRNLVEKAGHPSVTNGAAIRRRYCTLIISLKFLPLLQTWIQQKNIPDEDADEDAQFLKTHLEEAFEHMSTYDQYEAELHSGELSWTPAHRSDQFWFENATRLNENNYELLKILVQVVKDSDQPEMIAVAAHDIGEYIRYYPHGKKALDELGAKGAIMAHMVDSSDPTVRYEALIAIQKIMTHNWEFLGTAVGKDKAGK